MKPTADDIKRDKAFLAFIRTLPCAVCGQWADWEKRRCEAAHVRRAHNSGTATKPLFSAVPLCANHHRAQHQHGETAVMPKEVWDFKVKQYLSMWESQ